MEHVTYTHEEIPKIKKILGHHEDSDSSYQDFRLSKRRDREDIVIDLITCIALCHNVTPVLDEIGERSFQASSPDEVALVRFAEDVGYKLLSRDQSSIKIEVDGKVQVYEVLNNFPFSSETKRMGIIIK